MHIRWLPLRANTSSYSHILTMIPSSLTSSLLLWFSIIKFSISWISYFMYFNSYSLREGLKFHLFLLYLETYPSWPVPILWMLALAKPTSHIWSQTSVGCLKSMASCPWQLNPTNLKRWALGVLGEIFCKTPTQEEPWAHALLLSKLTASTTVLKDTNPIVTPWVHRQRLSLWTSLHNLMRGLSLPPPGKVSQGCGSCYKNKITALWKPCLKHKTVKKSTSSTTYAHWGKSDWHIRQVEGQSLAEHAGTGGRCTTVGGEWPFWSDALSAISSRK